MIWYKLFRSAALETEPKTGFRCMWFIKEVLFKKTLKE